MVLSLLDVCSIVVVSGTLGALISRYFTAHEWREHCEQNDRRWYSYQKRLIDEDLTIMEEKQIE